MNSDSLNPWQSDVARRVYGPRTSDALLYGMQPQRHRELNQILNTRPDPIDQRDFIYEPSLVNIPAKYINPLCAHRKFRVKEQGSEGTCVGQSLASLVELQNLQRHLDGADVPSRVSARYLYANAQLYDQHPDDSLPGSSLRGAIKGFYHNGACAEKMARYTPLQQDFKIRNNMRRDAQRIALGTYFRLEHVLNSYHCALIETGTILCSAIIHNGWNPDSVESDARHEKTGHIKYPSILRRSGMRSYTPEPCELSGGHAFIIVGYDETGFLVLNSWGNLWGRFPTSGLPEDFKHPLGDEGLTGIAHWSYADWAENVLDAWILRLAAPTRNGTNFVGGRSKLPNKKEKRSGSARKCDVQGHYMHVRDGQLVAEPPYENDLEYFEDVATALRQETENKHYRHIVFFAHGGLSTLDSASARAAAMIPTFKKNGIYPIFLFWRTGFGHMLGNIIEGILPEVEQRSQDFTEIKDAAIERLSKPIGRAIWNDIKRNAGACFDKDYEDFCESLNNVNEKQNRGIQSVKHDSTAWDATSILLNICTSSAEKYKNRPLKIHFIAHSAGVFLLGELFQRLKREKVLRRELFGSVNLMVPCCRTSYFIDNILPITDYVGRKRMTVFNLNGPAEQSIDKSMLPYSKSFASLVSNSFYDVAPERIAAIDEFWLSDVEEYIKNNNNYHNLRSKIEYVLSGDKTRDHTTKCSASYHGEFDNDADTMNYILTKIIGKRRAAKLHDNMNGFSYEQLNRGGF